MDCCKKSCGKSEAETKHSTVSEYYGTDLGGSKDLQTNACKIATSGPVPASLKSARSQVHPDVIKYFYGCGSPIPPVLQGCTVLDLGCGSGVDSFTCSKLVGESGKICGVDMTEEQLTRAKGFIDYHTKLFGFEKPNVEFQKGFIEDLSFLADDSIDVVISNCVINLCPEKEKVLREIFRVLKEGGELYFSDVYADRRIPKELQQDKVLWGECLSGALYLEDFRRKMTTVGFSDFRKVETVKVTVQNPEIERKVGKINFFSQTIRAFKLKSLEDACEDFGQTATYLGTIEDFPHAFFLDDHHTFVCGYPVAVCGNTADMLASTRYGKHFTVTPKGPHKGLFPCGPGVSGPICEGGGCC